eukprot:PhM_4_TR8728/c0_g1_i1/m.57136/K00459/ncd2, npd; nitronate monooxygenase
MASSSSAVRSFSNAFPTLKFPLMQGPVPATPALVAAARQHGLLATIPGAYVAPEDLDKLCFEVSKIATSTSSSFHPFGINLFAGGYEIRDDEWGETNDKLKASINNMQHLMNIAHRWLGTAERTAPPPPPPKPLPFYDQIDALIGMPSNRRPSVLTFTFGSPHPDEVAQWKKDKVFEFILGTATTVEEALVLVEDVGVDGVICQGNDAGGHRGTFVSSFSDGLEYNSVELTKRVVMALEDSSTKDPVLVFAAGGVMTGGDAKNTIRRTGASGAVLGSALLFANESGIPSVHRERLFQEGENAPSPTVVTPAFTGRPAQMLPNDFIALVESNMSGSVPPFCIQNTWTQQLRKESQQLSSCNYMPLFAGSRVSFGARQAVELTGGNRSNGGLGIDALLGKIIADFETSS